jgi:hypothetical protein
MQRGRDIRGGVGVLDHDTPGRSDDCGLHDPDRKPLTLFAPVGPVAPFSFHETTV